MTREETHLIQWECQQLLNRVMMLMDSARWEDLAACYTEDAVLFRPSDPDNGVEGREAILTSFRARAPRTTCHMLANSVFDVQSPLLVRATSRVLLISGEADQVHPAMAHRKLLAGTFIDDLAMVGGEWLIRRRVGSIELAYGDQ